MKNIDSVSAALEQAAILALQFTAAPRDYLGPATSATKEQAALGERLAAAIRALHVTGAPAAVPQVVADEREMFDRMYLSMHSFHTKEELDKEWHRTGAMFCAALAAAPAQPVAMPDGWKWMPIKATGGMADAGAFSGLPVGAAEPWIAKKVWEAMAAQSPAAPASQGDAKELTDELIYDIAAACEIGIGNNDHETSQRFEFARAILAAIAASKAAS